MIIVVIGPWMKFNDNVLNDSGFWSLKLQVLFAIFANIVKIIVGKQTEYILQPYPMLRFRL